MLVAKSWISRGWRGCQIVLLTLLVALSIGADPLVAEQPVHEARAFTPEGATFEIVGVVARSAEDSPGDVRVELTARNTTTRVLRELGIAVYVVSPDGEPRGFHTFTINRELAPGHAQYILYRSSAFQVQPGDRLILSPDFARGDGRFWDSGVEALDYQGVLDELPPTLELKLDSIGEVQINPFCERTCQVREERCRATCRCGVKEFTCTCDAEGGISSTCKCWGPCAE